VTVGSFEAITEQDTRFRELDVFLHCTLGKWSVRRI